MKLFRWISILVIFTFLSACGSAGIGGSIFPTDTPLPPPIVTIIPGGNPDTALTAYLDAFKADDYNTMYSLLSKVSQDANPLENFAVRNRDALNTLSAG